jgi:predicted RNA-binding Zn-ribbon protein involved in translation (DUF1610 family)
MRPQGHDDAISPTIVQMCASCDTVMAVTEIIPVMKGLDDVKYRCPKCGTKRKLAIEWGRLF